MNENLMFSVIGPIVVGLFLLFIEYRTGFFARSVSGLVSSKKSHAGLLKGKIDIGLQGDGTFEALESIKTYVSEITKEQRNGPVELANATRIDTGTELFFNYRGTDNQSHQVQVFTDQSWRIQEYKKIT